MPMSTVSSKTKVCGRCKRRKPVSEFYNDYNGTGKLYANCKVCHLEIGRAWYERNKKRLIAEATVRHRAKKLGMTVAEYKIGGEPETCGACGAHRGSVRNHKWSNGRKKKEDKGLAVDHDHETGAVRGFLCASCNMALGMMDDDPEILRALADYIEIRRAATAIP